MKRERFATAINCIDGRAQVPVIDWLRLHCNVQYVDLITEPGADKCLAQEFSDVTVTIKNKVRFSLEVHGSSVIAVVGHHGCIANPVSKEEHWEQISQGAKVVASWGMSVRVVGLYVNEWSSIDLISDTREQSVTRNYL